MSERPKDFGREVRDTVIKSGLTGVAATAVVVAALSPAGFGGMIGTSVASSLGLDTTAANGATDDPYASLPAYPMPLSRDEVSAIRGELARTAASLEITRAATEAKIEHIRSIALSGASSYMPVPPQSASVPEGLILASAPTQGSYTPPTPAPTVPPPPVEEAAPTPVNYSMANAEAPMVLRDRDLELADLLLAHEQF